MYKYYSPLGYLLIVYTVFTVSCSSPSKQGNSLANLPQEIDFNYHVKPILSDKCFACHGPDLANLKADFRLDTPEGAFETKLESGGHPIVPGDLAKSVAFQKIIAEDPDSKMPPPESNLTLTPYEIAILKKWIEQGAEYKPHWAYTKPEKSEIPQIENDEWPLTPIDNFIAQKHDELGLDQASEASKEQLIRRVSFDLTGLPPTQNELDDFLSDDSPNAYEKVVDRLLDSPHYGERMASEWLDVARYADSHGYQDDRPRTMWPWRDWVIKAYNQNLSYKDFVTWQLAGDLLPNATHDQKLASGFNRNHAITQEGGVIEEEYLTEYAADRLQTFGTAFMGLTMQCARCHDHKYDPISQKEYYQLFAFFNNNADRGIISYGDLSPQPAIQYENKALEEEIEDIKTMLSELEQTQKQYQPKVDDNTLREWYNQQDWAKLEQTGLETRYHLDHQEAGTMKDEVSGAYTGTLNFKLPISLAKPEIVEGAHNKALKFDGTNTLTIGDVGDFDHYQRFSLGGWIQYDELPTYHAGIISRRNGEHTRCGYGLYLTKEGKLSMQIVGTHNKYLMEIVTKNKIPKSEWTKVYGTYDGSGKAEGMNLYVNGEKQAVEVITDNLQGKSILVGTQVTVGHWMIRAGNPWKLGGFKGSIDEIAIYNRELSPLEVKYLYDNKPVFDQQVVYNTYIKREEKEWLTLQKKLDSLRSIDTTIPKVMVMKELEEPRPAYILARGVYSAKTEKVERSTPEIILPFTEEFPKNRLGLAQWLFHKDNPLTSRVIVNRLWQMIFGQGLVKTPEDYGNQGALPSHPALLDWLAVEFASNGWDTKAILKTMVMSATYRQSSDIDKRSYRVDPDNTYLARGPYKKLTAEMIRDQALASSGLLHRKVGGKWVKPYQPMGIWKEMANQIGENKYRKGRGNDLYRRSIYTYWKRTIPVPSMITFDAASRAECTVKRQATSTPLQSLVLLNDPQYVEASRKLAERLLLTTTNPEQQITEAFRALVTRAPSDEEIDMLQEIYQAELERFQSEPQNRRQLIAIGESASSSKVNQDELAALTVVVSAVLNLDETKHS